MNSNPTNNQVQDAALSVTTALPAAAANVTGTGIDLGAVNAQFAANGKFDVAISCPATPSLADAHAITLTLQDSADNITFTAIATLAATTITGAGGIGGPALAPVFYRLPGATRRYIALNAAVASGGGSNIAVSTTIQLLF